MSIDTNTDDIRYPVGRYETPTGYTRELLDEWTDILRALPSWMDVCIENIDHDQLRAPYRPGGWSIQQIVHHLADSHMNALVRLKLALTEDNPTIAPYNQDAWALLPDVDAVPVNISVTMLHTIHRRMVALLERLDDAAWTRTYYHPEHKRSFPVWELVATYAWHSRHHFAQVLRHRQAMGLTP